MPTEMTPKDSSQDFAVKKDFIDMQLELKKFLEEADVFTLSDLLRDPLVVHSIEDYASAYKELEELKKIRRTLKGLRKVKRRHVNLQSIIDGIDPFPHRDEDNSRIRFPDCSPRRSLFALNPMMPSKELTRDRMVQLFKEHMRRMDSITGVVIQRSVFSRNLSTSSSHSHLMKKIERAGDVSQSVFQKGGSEITSTASFRNGILRSTHADKGSKGHASMKPPRSRSGSPSHQNPHEALSSSSKHPKKPHSPGHHKNTGP